MNKRKAAALLAASVLLAGWIGGCADSASFFEFDMGYSDTSDVKAWGEAAVMNYEVPVSIPNIMVDQAGYQVGCRKIALFKGAELGETFQLVDTVTRNVVYEGELVSKGYDTATGDYISYGVFTEFDTPGTYYVQTDQIGRSYPFEVTRDMYGQIFEGAYRKLLAGQGEWSTAQRSYVLATLMTSYELYPAMYAGDGDNNNIPDVLDFTRERMEQLLEVKRPISLEETVIMLMFSRVYEDYDASFSLQCLRSAEDFWNTAQKKKDGYTAEELYLLDSQLYRTTGNRKYHTSILAYLKEDSLGAGSGLRMYADVAYLSTQSNVDLDLCTELMGAYMNRAESIAQISHEQALMVADTDFTKEKDQLLQHMVEIAFADYVITNHEYANVMENHLHFFLGRNPESVSYLSDYGDVSCRTDEDILKDPVTHANFVFMMSAVMNHNTDTEQ